jgi:hypothetical protein
MFLAITILACTWTQTYKHDVCERDGGRWIRKTDVEGLEDYPFVFKDDLKTVRHGCSLSLKGSNALVVVNESCKTFVDRL